MRKVLSLLGWVSLAIGAAIAQTPVITSPTAYSGQVMAPAFVPQNLSAGPWSYWFDDFFFAANFSGTSIGAAAANSCSEANTAQDANHPGTMRLASGTGGAATGEACYNTASSAQIATVNSSVPWTWETAVLVAVLPATTAATYQAGVVGTPGASPWTTGVGFELSSANGVVNDWYCLYGATPTLVDSTLAATTGWVRLTMVSDGVNLHWYINGAQVCGTGVALTNITNAAVYPFAFTDVAGTGTSMFFSSDYVIFTRKMTR